MRWDWIGVGGDDVVARCVCDSLRDWLEFLVRSGGPYERCDDPRERMLGMRKVEGGTRIMLPLVRVMDRTSWGIEFPSNFVDDYLKTQGARDRLAHALTVGDHCLKF
jgi:hypothetical protein